jgi:hypothetical protein
VTKLIWHKTVHIHTRVLEVQPPIQLGDWEVYSPYGSGRGVLTVAAGPTPTPPKEIKAMLRVNGMWRVISHKDGYFIVTVWAEREWGRIEAEVIQAYVVAKEKDGQDGNS